MPTIELDNLEEKARWLDAAAGLDRADMIGLSRKLLQNARANTPRRAAEAFYYFVRDRIRYARDLVGNRRAEDFATAKEVAKRGYDDCDGKCRLFVALCRASEPETGLQARIVPVFQGWHNFAHVQAEVRWPYQDWIRLELILGGIPFGMGPETAPPAHRVYSGPNPPRYP